MFADGVGDTGGVTGSNSTSAGMGSNAGLFVGGTGSNRDCGEGLPVGVIGSNISLDEFSGLDGSESPDGINSKLLLVSGEKSGRVGLLPNVGRSSLLDCRGGVCWG